MSRPMRPTDGFSLDRRRLLATGAGLLISFALPAGRARARTEGPDFAPNAFVRIDQAGKITLIMRDAEMGQGIWTGASMLLAEELDVGMDQITPDFAPPNERLYSSPILGMQATGGSTSIRGDWEGLRKAGAIARAVLVQAAARQWSVNPESCIVRRGVVSHQPSGRSVNYASLVLDAAKLPLPTDVPLKDPREWTIIGTSQKRVDTAGKINGQTIYGIDVKLPGLKVATVAMCPVLGGKLVTVDETAARKIAGFIGVLRLDNGVAVVGDHFWAAKQGLEALDIEWSLGSNVDVNQGDLVEGHRKAAEGDGIIAKSEGDAQSAIANATIKISAVYQLPLLAHTTMEPINCTVHVQDDSVEVWCGTQVPTRARDEAARAAAMPADRVIIHSHMMGGGFGRRLEAEYVGIAVAFAKQVSFPLKMIWSRETDVQHDRYRPYYYDKVSAGLDRGGKVVGWIHKTTGSSVTARWAPAGMRANGIDPDAVECAEDLPYDVGALQVSWVRHEPRAITTAWWRGVGPAHNVFVIESFIDELAHAARQDPLAFRISLLQKTPRALKVLELAAEKAQWGTPLPMGCGRGIMVQSAFGSYLSIVCEVDISDGTIRLRRMVAAVDCGQAINPDSVRAQIEGGLIFGLSSAIYSEITLSQGRVDQSNFNNYRVLRMDEAPTIDVYIVQSSEKPGGLGEAGTAAAFPALANAVFSASGKRLRCLPLINQVAGL